MLTRLYSSKGGQLVLGFLAGVVFGFLLQKGGATKYDVIIGQLLLEDFTVVKIMLSAVVVGMIGVHVLRSLGLAQLHPKPGTLGSIVIGGLLFGCGFATLGYCPGTVAGAVGNGQLDALVGGVGGIVLGAWLFAVLYPTLQRSILGRGDFGSVTFPELLKVNAWLVAVPVAAGLVGVLVLLEWAGL
jgi:hypothetical protein